MYGIYGFHTVNMDATYQTNTTAPMMNAIFLLLVLLAASLSFISMRLSVAKPLIPLLLFDYRLFVKAMVWRW